MLRNKFIDHIRRHRRRADLPTEGELFAIEPICDLEQREAVEQVLQHVRGKKDLEDWVLAISESDGGPAPNKELADDLRTTVSDVVNRKKRIRRSCEKGQSGQPKSRKEPRVR